MYQRRYKSRTRKSYTRSRPASRSNVYRTAVLAAKREIKKEDRKDHPLMWYDFNDAFNGDYVKTTPTMVSIGKILRDYFISDTGITYGWRMRTDPTGGGAYKEAKVRVTGLQYQLRYQQNAEAADPTIDTVRHLCYSFADTYDENADPLLNGGDIDQAPNTTKVLSMHWDKICTLRGQTTEISTDDTQFVPGQRIYKGYVRFNKVFDYVYDVSANTFTWKQEDVRFEHQSDDNSLVGEVQVYGFFRVYFRIY